MNRRDWARAMAAPAAASLASAAEPSLWTPEWDRALIETSLAAQARIFDPAESMLVRQIGPEYHYHTNLRSTRAHPTRDSLEYALTLLEGGGDANDRRALAILDRILAIQETDPESKWYGIWGYYLEEPAPKMSPADWNWADFNGSILLLIDARHGQRLSPALRERVRDSIRHAAYSVKRRNVTMTYTNIAVQGTFVTLAAAELLKDDALTAYATDRWHRFARQVDETGSFNEYNSPTYANVTIVNLTRMRMLVRNEEMLALANRIHERAWLHLGKHWHAATRQLAGPLSRCYSTDIRSPLWIQKALGGKLAFASLEEVRAGKAGGSPEIAIQDYRCPEAQRRWFLEPTTPRLHRELFIDSKTAVPVQGTTWMEKAYSLGSVNRGDFWVQRRPLLAYFGGPARPARYIQVRFVKDDYDFASALFYSVQEKGRVLGAVAFRSPGGDKHPSLDPIQSGEFTATRLRLRLDITGGPVKVESDGPVFRARLPGVKLQVGFPAAYFGKTAAKPESAAEDGFTTISLDLFRSGQPATIRWSEIDTAFAVFAMSLDGTDPAGVNVKQDGGIVQATWRDLSLTAPAAVAGIDRQDAVFASAIGGKPVPIVRLSDQKLDG